MKSVWVIGGTGMTGSALLRELRAGGAARFSPAAPFTWADEASLPDQIGTAVADFARHAASANSWEIYWAAGIGNMGSIADQLHAETTALDALLGAISRTDALRRSNGFIAFSSSAGAIYAGCGDDIISEHSAPAPTTPYGREKMKQEAILRSFSANHSSPRILIARFSTIFGPRLYGRAPQGLFGHLARSMFTAEPVRIFVPLDTIRDYIFSEDAARSLIASLRCMDTDERLQTRIIGSERSTAIAEIISTFGRVGHRYPRIVTGATALTSKYTGRIQYRSCVGPRTAARFWSPLHICVARVLEEERLRYVTAASVARRR